MFHIYILKLVGERTTNQSIDLLNDICVFIAKRYITTVCDICTFYNKKTIDSKTIILLTKIWLPSHHHLLEYCKNVWDTYSNHEGSGLHRDKRSDLCFSVVFVKNFIDTYKRTDQKIGELSYIYLACILNYFCESIINQLDDNEILTPTRIVEIINCKEFELYPLIDQLSIVL